MCTIVQLIINATCFLNTWRLSWSWSWHVILQKVMFGDPDHHDLYKEFTATCSESYWPYKPKFTLLIFAVYFFLTFLDLAIRLKTTGDLGNIYHTKISLFLRGYCRSPTLFSFRNQTFGGDQSLRGKCGFPWGRAPPLAWQDQQVLPAPPWVLLRWSLRLSTPASSFPCQFVLDWQISSILWLQLSEKMKKEHDFGC